MASLDHGLVSSSHTNGSGSRSLTARAATRCAPGGRGKSHGAGMLSSSHGGSGRRLIPLPVPDNTSSLTRTGPGRKAGWLASSIVSSALSTPSRTTATFAAIFTRNVAGSRAADNCRVSDDGCDVGEDSGGAVFPDYGPVGNGINGEGKGVLLPIADDPNHSDHHTRRRRVAALQGLRRMAGRTAFQTGSESFFSVLPVSSGST